MKTMIVAIAIGLACFTMACSGRVARPAETACHNQPVSVILGFERAQVGSNELPVAIVCNPRSTAAAPRANHVAASFEPQPPVPGTKPVRGEVVYQPAARVLESDRERLRFDYLVKVVLDRAGRWAMQLRVRVPWRAEEASTVIAFPVDERQPETVSDRPE